MPLKAQVLEVFSAHGVLSKAAQDYVPRQGQIDMAVAIADVLQTGGALVVEAGTGVGKTFTATTRPRVLRKHPHGRGEDRLCAGWSAGSG